MTSPSSATPLGSTDPTDSLLPTLSEWHQDQFERHLRYARSLGLSPDHANRFARQQLRIAAPASTQ